MDDYITIRTKDPHGRLGTMQFCKADLVVLAQLLRTEILTADLEVLLIKDPNALKKLSVWPPLNSASNVVVPGPTLEANDSASGKSQT